jgi:hypothetical protein
MNWTVLNCDRLSLEALQELNTRGCGAIRIASYCPPDLASRLAAALVRDSSRTNYPVRWTRVAANDDIRYAGSDDARNATDVDRVGPADIDPCASGLDGIRRFRALAHPYLHPIDRLRLELDEIMPGGAKLARQPHGTKAMSGLGRVMDRSDALIHADTGRRDCLTANVYLRMPPKGGGVRIWDFDGEFSRSRYSVLFEDPGVLASARAASVEPGSGDLVIWNPLCPHVVTPFEAGPRVAVQTWIRLVAASADSALAAEIFN